METKVVVIFKFQNLKHHLGGGGGEGSLSFLFCNFRPLVILSSNTQINSRLCLLPNLLLVSISLG